MEQNVGKGVTGEAEALGLAHQKQHKPVRIDGLQVFPSTKV